MIDLLDLQNLNLDYFQNSNCRLDPGPNSELRVMFKQNSLEMCPIF